MNRPLAALLLSAFMALAVVTANGHEQEITMMKDVRFGRTILKVPMN